MRDEDRITCPLCREPFEGYLSEHVEDEHPEDRSHAGAPKVSDYLRGL